MKRRVVNAGGWTVLVYGFTQAMRLASSLIMTRLLAPEAFGVMAIAIVVNTGLALFSDIGLRQSIIRSHRGNDPVFLDTVWSIQIARGLVIFFTAGVICLFNAILQNAGVLASGTVYANSGLPYVVAAVAFSAVLAGFESTKVALAQRDLELGRLTLMEMGCALLAVLVSVSWAILDASIWALVGGWLIAALVKMLLTHLVLPGRNNSFRWESTAVHEIFDFGKWIFLSSILTFFVLSADRLLLGAFFSAELLGMYAIAYLIVNSIQQGVLKLSSGVALPVLGEVFRRDSPDALRSMYYRGRFSFDVAALFSAGFLWQAGEKIVAVLYDPRYLAAGPMLSVLALTLVAIRYDVAEKCLLAKGRPHWLTVINLARLILLGVLIPLGFIWFGFAGALWSLVLASVLGVFVVLWIKAREELLDIWCEIKVLPIMVLGALIGKGVCVWIT